jgi:hypothetical protein
MAKYKNPNVVMHGLSGIVGDLLMISQRYGKTYLGKIPSNTAAPSEDQLAIRERFQKAVRYARLSLTDPLILSIYQEKSSGDLRPFNVAIADFFNAPTIHAAITEAYTGAVGSIIDLEVTDNVAVKSVEVSITAANGDLLEQGNAVQEANSSKWSYTATVLNNLLAGTTILVKAKDHPGNETVFEKTL